MAPAWTGDELSSGQVQNGVNFYSEVKFDLEGQGQSPTKTIGILTKVFYTYSPHLVILAWRGDELSRGQTWWRTDGRTDAGNNNTRRPILASGKNGQHLANDIFKCIWLNDDICILIRISEIHFQGPRDNESAWVQVMVLCHPDNTPEQIMTLSTHWEWDKIDTIFQAPS